MKIFLLSAIKLFKLLLHYNILQYIILIMNVISYFTVYILLIIIKHLNMKTNLSYSQQTIGLINKQLRRIIFFNNMTSRNKKA